MSLEMKEITVPGYEKVIHAQDTSVGLSAIIAIHDTTLGPALGGTRIYPYATFDEALTDVLRLSKGMTYKSAIVASNLGGGKSVIIADPKTENKRALLLAFGRAVEALQGEYICAEDVGCSTKDVAVIREVTPYVVGLEHEKSSGNPSPYTAFGTLMGIQASLQEVYGTSSVKGKRIAIQGLGSVGQRLAEFLYWLGADLIVSDINENKVKEIAHTYGAEIASTEEIYRVQCDVFAPCALGGVLNVDTIAELNCAIVAGCANNQLLHPETDAQLLHNRNILYAVDFVINAGGLINVMNELKEFGYRPKVAREQVENIYNQLLKIYALAKEEGINTYEAVLQIVSKQILQHA